MIIIPIVPAYRKYYGTRAAAVIVAIMLGTMVAAALIVNALFAAFELIPSTRPSIDSITGRGIEWNYTTFLNIVFFGVAAVLFALTVRRGPAHAGHHHAHHAHH